MGYLRRSFARFQYSNYTVFTVLSFMLSCYHYYYSTWYGIFLILKCSLQYTYTDFNRAKERCKYPLTCDCQEWDIYAILLLGFSIVTIQPYKWFITSCLNIAFEITEKFSRAVFNITVSSVGDGHAWPFGQVHKLSGMHAWKIDTDLDCLHVCITLYTIEGS